MAIRRIEVECNDPTTEARYVGVGANDIVQPGMLVKEARVSHSSVNYDGLAKAAATDAGRQPLIVRERNIVGQGVNEEIAGAAANANLPNAPFIVAIRPPKGRRINVRIVDNVTVNYGSLLTTAAGGLLTPTGATVANAVAVALDDVDTTGAPTATALVEARIL